MARSHHLPPSAASLTASLRDLGYSLETAIADLIDNSISAGATDIQLFCDMNQDVPVFVIADNGCGMTETEVIDAMRHGATNPRKKRGPKDLGRFGLGLKTASFSQCRCLTVISSVKGKRVGAEWNLNRIEDDDDWNLSVLEPQEAAEQPFIEVLGEKGTLVIWRDLDRLFEDETGKKRDEIVNEKLVLVERHLSLVFHRFLSGEISGKKKISIKINGHLIPLFDPFCRKNQATQILQEEKVWVGKVAVVIQPYILPHHSRLSADEYDYYQDRSDFISNQGVYVYRNGRLMAWGDWFRLVAKGEATKLARVQIDFPNSLDEAWTIDIKKSRVRPPHVVRERLRQILSQITERSVNVHRSRGQKLIQESQAPIWERYGAHGGSGIRYALNIDHPLVVSLCAKLSPLDVTSLHVLLNAIAAALPIEMIYSDFSNHPRMFNQTEEDQEQIWIQLNNIKQAMYNDVKGDPDDFRQIVRSTHMFDAHLELVDKFIKEVFT